DSSALHDMAHKYVRNHGLAEEVFLMNPDLILASTYSSSTTISLLRRLGFRVEQFAPETSFDDVRENILRMGELLGSSDSANRLVNDLNEGLAQLQTNSTADLVAATYSSNSYTSGKRSLSD